MASIDGTGRSAGRLVGIARRALRRAPMEEIADGVVTVAGGLEGDFKGAKSPRRRITATARVLEGGRIALGDRVEVLIRPPEVKPRLP